MIIFMGVAGSGKSVQGRMLADKLTLPWLSTGQFLSMLVSGDRRRDMLAGKLLEDKETIELLQKIFTVVDSKEEFVLDGFPRSLEQADWLLGQVKHEQLSVTAVIHLKASMEVVKKRLLGRARADDHEEAIQERFTEYEQAAIPIINKFKSAGIEVYDINAEQDINKIHQDIVSALQK